MEQGFTVVRPAISILVFAVWFGTLVYLCRKYSDTASVKHKPKSKPKPKPNPVKVQTCSVCFEPTTTTLHGHPICRDCAEQLVKAKLDNRGVEDMYQCSLLNSRGEKCKIGLESQHLRALMPTSEGSVFSQFRKLERQALNLCPCCSSSHAPKSAGMLSVNSICGQCRTIFCKECWQIAPKLSSTVTHLRTCSTVSQDSRMILDSRDLKLIRDLACSKCPGCGMVVEKFVGCNHMTHYSCPGRDSQTVQFCYLCGEEINVVKDHFPHGSYHSCNNPRLRIQANMTIKPNIRSRRQSVVRLSMVGLLVVGGLGLMVECVVLLITGYSMWAGFCRALILVIEWNLEMARLVAKGLTDRTWSLVKAINSGFWVACTTVAEMDWSRFKPVVEVASVIFQQLGAVANTSFKWFVGK